MVGGGLKVLLRQWRHRAFEDPRNPVRKRAPEKQAVNCAMFADSRQESTWVGLQLMVPLQGEDQGAGSRAKYLSRSKVHAVIYLEVKAARQCTCTRTEWKE